MKIAYHATIEEMAEVHLRVAKRSTSVKPWRRNGAFTFATLAAVASIVVLPEPLNVRLVFAGILAILCGSVSWFVYPTAMYRRTRELAVEKFGPTNGADVEIELRDSGVWTRTGDWQIEVAWAGVDEVEEDPSLIEFRMKDGGSVIARKRAFAEPQQMDSFLRLARERVAGSRSIG